MKVYNKKTEIIFNSQFKDPLLNHITEKIIFHLTFAKGKKILDLGCGVGRVSILAGLNGFQVLGIDIEKKAIDIANEESLRLGLGSHCKFRHGDVLETEHLKNKKFDVLICSEVIEHVKNPERIIRITHNVLKKDGLLILTTPHDPKQWTVIDKYAEHVKRFRIVEIKNLLSDFRILKLYTIGFPFMRSIVALYNILVRFKLIKHDTEWRAKGGTNNLYNFTIGILLRIDDLFNYLYKGTTIIVVAKKESVIEA